MRIASDYTLEILVMIFIHAGLTFQHAIVKLSKDDVRHLKCFMLSATVTFINHMYELSPPLQKLPFYSIIPKFYCQVENFLKYFIRACQVVN